MSNHETPTTDTACNSDSWADAKAIMTVITVVVVTACFWLLGR